ncbi:MAG: gfo/Idh/MocA family oxidoreductase, partial [Pseudomonadota bacterium]
NRLASHAAENRRLTMGEMEVDGSGGSIRLSGDGGISVRAHDSNEWRAQDYAWEDRVFGGDCVYLTNKAALAALRSGAPAETEVAAYLRNIAIEEAVYRSNDERRWIDV